MTVDSLMAQIIHLLFGTMTEGAEELGGAVNDFVTAMAYTGTGENQTLSVFFTLVLIFCGVSLMLAIGRLILNWISGLTGGNL